MATFVVLWAKYVATFAVLGGGWVCGNLRGIMGEEGLDATCAVWG